MFEGRKAKKLGIVDMGKLGSRGDSVTCQRCNKGIRKGRLDVNNQHCHWCPGCNKILYEVR
jgi:hypothetical protein